MTPTAQGILERLCTAYDQGRRLVLVFDYDGTLTPLAPLPHLAVLDPKSRQTLAQLAAIPRATLGVISGRTLDDLIHMVNLPGLHYGGSIGLEMELAGKRDVAAETLACQPLLDTLKTAINARLAAYPNAILEQKKFGFAVHYRRLAPELTEALETEMLALLAPHTTQLQVISGSLIIEVIPNIGKDKGTAIRAIVALHGSEPMQILYAGDSPNDTAGLLAARDLGGIALGIGPESPAEATEHLPTPADLIALLTALAATLAETATA